MDPLSIIDKYYKEGSDIYNMLVKHSTLVMNKALAIAEKHPELGIDTQFVREAAMLHDIGVLFCYAPSIHLDGTMPYICHGYLGRELLEKEGYPKHALVCERHTGTGLTLEDIKEQNLPLPLRDMKPQSMEEKVICFADCFFSKTQPDREKPLKEVRDGIAKFGEEKEKEFDEMCALFL